MSLMVFYCHLYFLTEIQSTINVGSLIYAIELGVGTSFISLHIFENACLICWTPFSLVDSWTVYNTLLYGWFTIPYHFLLFSADIIRKTGFHVWESHFLEVLYVSWGSRYCTERVGTNSKNSSVKWGNLRNFSRSMFSCLCPEISKLLLCKNTQLRFICAF